MFIRYGHCIQSYQYHHIIICSAYVLVNNSSRAFFFFFSFSRDFLNISPNIASTLNFNFEKCTLSSSINGSIPFRHFCSSAVLSDYFRLYLFIFYFFSVLHYYTLLAIVSSYQPETLKKTQHYFLSYTIAFNNLLVVSVKGLLYLVQVLLYLSRGTNHQHQGTSIKGKCTRVIVRVSDETKACRGSRIQEGQGMCRPCLF